MLKIFFYEKESLGEIILKSEMSPVVMLTADAKRMAVDAVF
jgi:hypothetical protein